MHQPGGEDLNLRIQVEQGLVRNCPLLMSLIAGRGGGAALWEAVEDGGDREVQGHQAHLQRPQHDAGKSYNPFVHYSQRMQVFFEARKKLRMRRLKELAAAKTADQLPSLGSGKQLAAEGMIPAALVYDLTLAYLDTWTTRFLLISRNTLLTTLYLSAVLIRL